MELVAAAASFLELKSVLNMAPRRSIGSFFKTARFLEYEVVFGEVQFTAPNPTVTQISRAVRDFVYRIFRGCFQVHVLERGIAVH
mmetsp:Transcript_38557/g.56682  ORF Transcript_38557/g.56682 Transcript_38557/m.56682 type:complete len:85 (+) Transcript_38557:277-531(+)